MVSAFFWLLTISCAVICADQDVISDIEANQGAHSPAPALDYLHEFTKPWTLGDPEERIEFTFENAELSMLIAYMKERFGIEFIEDDNLKPLAPGGKSIAGFKISFRTYQPLTKKESWSLFTTFLDAAGVSVVPGPSPRIYRLVNNDPKSPFAPGKQPIPLFVGTDLEQLPQDDSTVRYMLFVYHTSLDSIVSVINELKSVSSPRPIVVPDMRAIIVTDKASIVRTMLQVVRELDSDASAETLRVLLLERADATRAVALYKELVKNDEPSLSAKLMGQRKKPNMHYLPDLVKLVPVPHLNSIIIMGTRDSVDRAYDFIQKTLDRKSFVNHAPLFIYPLKHLKADEIARILNAAAKFQSETEAGKSGGLRDGDKYFKTMKIEPEPSGNRLIISADYDDYKHIYDLLQRLDIEQPQVALQVLILNVEVDDDKEIGTQLRNKFDGAFNKLFGNNVNFQTSGFAGTGSSVVENTSATGAQRLLGDLISLASLSGNTASTLLTLGQDIYGVWGMFKLLESYVKVAIVDNPFLVTTNKYPAQVKLAEVRRVVDSVIEGQQTAQANKDLSASLQVDLTPQVSRDGLITLDIRVLLEDFTGSESDTTTNGNRNSRNIQTSVVVPDGEVLALGGLVRERVIEQVSKVPVFGDLPIIGNLFKNTTQAIRRTSLIILVIPKIILPEQPEVLRDLTERKISETRELLDTYFQQPRDPILRWFFGSTDGGDQRTMVDEFQRIEGRYKDPSDDVQPIVEEATPSSSHFLRLRDAARVRQAEGVASPADVLELR